MIDTPVTYPQGRRVYWLFAGQTFYGSIDHYATDNDGILVAHIIPDDPTIVLATVDADRVHPDACF